eukprot:TRINITY_DN6649_c0_g1_i1.p1 TRINITY_DN6649_c0_g1~~TRINITY_DN6649_c0_g1_i1.p1  ORF type:complete len:1177 (+),score=253.25 TRINITY_DN6649_c0_g1_i1:160-3690(+)
MSPPYHVCRSQQSRPALASFARCSPKALALMSLLLCRHASAAPVLADGQVHDLTASNFADSVKANDFSFVEFYAPWCGHCKKLVPEWEKTAALCKDASVMVAKVDAIAEKSLAQEHGVESFPTLRLYRGSAKVSVKYEGARTGDKMAEWAAAKSKQTLLVQAGSGAAGVEAARKLASSDKAVGVIGLVSGKDPDDTSLQKALEDVSFALNPKDPGADIPVAIVTDVDEATLEAIGAPPGQKLPAVALLRSFDFEEKVLFQSIDSGTSHRKSFKSVMTWIAAKRVPALIPGSQETEKFFLSDIDPGNGALMYFGEEETLRRGLHELAVKFSDEKRLKWIHLKNNDFGESLGKSVGLTKSDFPEVVLWEFGETEDSDKVFRFSQQASAAAAAASKDSVETFVKAWQAGELSAEKDPVTSVTSDTFDDIVVKNDKHVLVEFYAPWCGHCKALAPEYKLVAQHYANDPEVDIVKMDATAHKHSSVDIKSYPTLKLYLKGKKGSPVDGEFKSTRDKQGIIDFIEKTRGSNVPSGQEKGKSGKGGSKNEEVKTQAKASSSTPSAMASAPQPKTTSEQAAKDGVWIFDDAMQPESQGMELSHDMVNSREGFTLVQVGDVGLLLFQQGGARAVRRFPSAAEARAYVQRVKQPTKTAASASSEAALPCPDNPNLHSCKAWCEGVWPGDDGIRSTLGGTGCSDLSAASPAHERPSCMCYDKDYRMQLAMCVSSCRGFPAPAAGPGPAAGSGTETCSAGDSSCSAALSSSTEKDEAEDSMIDKRFVLYDTKYGEGFNLQREVYPRAGWVVSEVNKALDKKCGSKRSGSCGRWVLVLPPWCQVVHWWTGPDHVPWKTFFDTEALKSSKVPVIEFQEYVALTASQQVDLAVSFETDQLKSQRGKLSGGQGKFVGFAQSLGDCNTKYAKPLEFQKLPSGELQVVYAGHCDGGIAAKELRCAALDGPWPEGVANMVSSLDSNVRSVLLKNYDYLLAPDTEQLDDLGLRESMYFAKELRQSADQFISTALKGEKYLAAHCRRTDFLRAREKTTPDVSNIADKLNEVMAKEGLNQVFIATDAPDELRAELQQQVKGSVVFYDAKHGATQFDHKGKQAIVETWIAARADFFIGTIESRFTMSIQLERSFLGKAHKTSEQEFCKNFKAGKKPCVSPAYRHRSYPGKYRESYIDSR